MKFRERQFFWRLSHVVIFFIVVFLLFYYCPSPFSSSPGPLDNLSLQPFHKESSIIWPELREYSPESYPEYRSLLTHLENWNPDQPQQPNSFLETLQHFNYSDPDERAMAEKYRNAEVPFKLYDIPELDRVRRRWDESYLTRAMRFEWPRVEESTDNHFMFFIEKAFPHWKPPQRVTTMSFTHWSHLAHEADILSLPSNASHFYYVLGSRPHDTSSSFIARDLSFFSTQTENFFVTSVKSNKGIQCRFGMRGVIAASHYDSGRNMIAMIRGKKRYLLTPPETCRHLGIISNRDHPSYRHSTIDWSNLTEAREAGFGRVKSIDTIVHEGEVLYVPSFWFHYIVSLEYSIQCNSRSGFPANMRGYDSIRARDCMNQRR
jgi:hypothetical protein